MAIGDWIGAIFTRPGPGGIVVAVVFGLAATTYALVTRWILDGGRAEDEWWTRR